MCHSPHQGNHALTDQGPSNLKPYPMLTSSPHVVVDSRQKQLRALNLEHRDTLEALNHAEASIVRARKLNDIKYHRRRRAILANGHDDNAE